MAEIVNKKRSGQDSDVDENVTELDLKRLCINNTNPREVRNEVQVEAQLEAPYDIVKTFDEELMKYLFLHQREAISFMYKNLIGSPMIVNNEDVKHGAILAHSMGLGKTYTIIAYLYGILANPVIKKHINRVLIFSNVIGHWIKKLRSDKWTKYFNDIPTVFKLSDKLHGNREAVQRARYLEVQRWFEKAKEKTQVLIMSYDVYNILINGPKKPKEGKKKTILKRRKNMKGKIVEKKPTVFVEESKEEKRIRKELTFYLQNPGPDVVIFDEAHILKNDVTIKHITKNKIKTGRRILLTGTLMPNNLKELYNLVSFVNKDKTILGSKEEFDEKYGEPIDNGKCYDTRPHRGRAERKTKKLYELLEKNVMHSRGEEYLKDLIKINKTEITLMLKPTEEQEWIYKICKENKEIFNTLFRRHHFHMDLNTHPSMVKNKMEELELEQQPDSPEDVNENIKTSNRMFILFEMINICREKGEKLVVFSEKHNTMNYIEEWLDESWIKNVNYFRVDGRMKSDDRKNCFKTFKKSNEAFLCILTTKAASLGCSLIAANRMVIVDHTFNPSWNIQAVRRIYRMKQKRDVFIYRLVIPFTSEDTTYKSQITKESQSLRVVYKKQIEPQFRSDELKHVNAYEPVEKQFREERLSILHDPLVREIVEKNLNLILDIENHEEHYENDKITEEWVEKLIIPIENCEEKPMEAQIPIPIQEHKESEASIPSQQQIEPSFLIPSLQSIDPELLDYLYPMEEEIFDDDNIKIIFHRPDSKTHIESYDFNQLTEVLISFCETNGYNMQTHSLLFGDRKEISHMDYGKSFRELQWGKRENIFVHKKLSS